MNILEIKQALASVQADIKAAVIAGSEMAQKPTTQLEDLRVHSDKVEALQIKEALLKQDLERLENEGKPAPTKDVKKSGFANKAEFLKAVYDAKVSGMVDRRLTSVKDTASGMSEGVPADGGYLVPPEYADGVLDFVRTESVLYPQTRKVEISGNRLIDIYIDEASRADGASRHGGVYAFWKAEAAQLTAVKAATHDRETPAEKLTALVPVTEELMQDAAALDSMIDQLVGKEFAFKVDDAILNGTGKTGNMPIGILSTGNNALVTVAKEASQAAGSVLVDNILKLRNALIAQCRKNAKFYINQDLEMSLIKLFLQTGANEATSTAGIPLYMFAGQAGNAEDRLLGIPVVPIEQCNAVGSKGDIVLADMSQYLMVKRTTITRQSSMHVRFDYDENEFKYTWRIGGRPDWMNAITPYKGSTQRSPYVTLAARG